MEPVPQEVGSGTGRLALVEGEEACPLLGGQGPPRSSILFLPVGRLPPLQQNQSLQGVLTPPKKEQQRSVQSDQGYISRNSPQPPNNDNDNREGVGEEDRGQPLSPQGLKSLRSLQLLLFFQELSKNPGLEPEKPPWGALPQPGR